MSFKDFFSQEIEVECPHKEGGKAKVAIPIKEYKELLENSSLRKTKKEIVAELVNRGEIPCFCEQHQKFFMINLKNNQTRDIKSRTDKEMCGALFNAMLNESKKNDQEVFESYSKVKLGWDAPACVFITE